MKRRTTSARCGRHALRLVRHCRQHWRHAACWLPLRRTPGHWGICHAAGGSPGRMTPRSHCPHGRSALQGQTRRDSAGHGKGAGALNTRRGTAARQQPRQCMQGAQPRGRARAPTVRPPACACAVHHNPPAALATLHSRLHVARVALRSLMLRCCRMCCSTRSGSVSRGKGSSSAGGGSIVVRAPALWVRSGQSCNRIRGLLPWAAAGVGRIVVCFVPMGGAAAGLCDARSFGVSTQPGHSRRQPTFDPGGVCT